MSTRKSRRSSTRGSGKQRNSIFQYVRSQRGEVSGKSSQVYHCPADFETENPEDPSSSVGITFVVSNRTKTEDDVQSPSKLKIPKDAKYKNALTRFLRILETEKEGVIVVQDLCCRGSLQTLKIDKSKRRLSGAKSCTTLCGCNAHILRILNHVDTVS